MKTCGDCVHAKNWGFLEDNYVCCKDIVSELRYKQVYTLKIDEEGREVPVFNPACENHLSM